MWTETWLGDCGITNNQHEQKTDSVSAATQTIGVERQRNPVISATQSALPDKGPDECGNTNNQRGQTKDSKTRMATQPAASEIARYY